MGGADHGGQYGRCTGGRISYAAGMDRDRRATPNTVPWPPLLYGGAAVLALLLDRAVPLPAVWVGGQWLVVLSMVFSVTSAVEYTRLFVAAVDAKERRQHGS